MGSWPYLQPLGHRETHTLSIVFIKTTFPWIQTLKRLCHWVIKAGALSSQQYVHMVICSVKIPKIRYVKLLLAFFYSNFPGDPLSLTILRHFKDFPKGSWVEDILGLGLMSYIYEFICPFYTLLSYRQPGCQEYSHLCSSRASWLIRGLSLKREFKLSPTQ